MAKKPTTSKPTTSKPASKQASGSTPTHHLSAKTRKKISKALTGRHLTKATKAKISKSLRQVHKKPSAVGLSQGTDWILGANDLYPTCAAVAVANHRWLATGCRMTDDEILALEESVGSHIEDLFAALGAEVFPVEQALTGTILVMSTPYGHHATLYDGHKFSVSWGGLALINNVDVEEIWYAKWTQGACGS